MALRHQRVLCHGQPVWALDMANGQHKCACGKLLTLVDAGPLPVSRRDGVRDDLLRPDWRELEQESRERDLSTHDFDSPWKDAA